MFLTKNTTDGDYSYLVHRREALGILFPQIRYVDEAISQGTWVPELDAYTAAGFGIQAGLFLAACGRGSRPELASAEHYDGVIEKMRGLPYLSIAFREAALGELEKTREPLLQKAAKEIDQVVQGAQLDGLPDYVYGPVPVTVHRTGSEQTEILTPFQLDEFPPIPEYTYSLKDPTGQSPYTMAGVAVEKYWWGMDVGVPDSGQIEPMEEGVLLAEGYFRGMLDIGMHLITFGMVAGPNAPMMITDAAEQAITSKGRQAAIGISLYHNLVELDPRFNGLHVANPAFLTALAADEAGILSSLHNSLLIQAGNMLREKPALASLVRFELTEWVRAGTLLPSPGVLLVALKPEMFDFYQEFADRLFNSGVRT